MLVAVPSMGSCCSSFVTQVGRSSHIDCSSKGHLLQLTSRCHVPLMQATRLCFRPILSTAAHITVLQCSGWVDDVAIYPCRPARRWFL